MRRLAVLVLSAAGLCLGGCNYLSYLMYLGSPTMPSKTIEPEYKGYAQLEGKSIAVVVFADQKTLFDYPDLREQICSVVGYQMTKNIRRLKTVDHQRIAKFQDENLNWESMDRTELGHKLKADYVLYISVEDFSTLEPGSTYLQRGRLEAQTALYQCSLPEKDACVWPGGQMQVAYPENDAVGQINLDERTLRNKTVAKFADLLAKKFYKHTEKEEELEADKK